ncbi:MAG: pyruvate formate lyase family protein [Planctomycetota bacterium]|jgi:formate C-acetyltransferase
MIIDEQLRREAMERRGSFPRKVNPFSRSVALWRASAAGGSRVQVRARYLHELVKLASIEIDSGWTLAGNHLPTEGHGLELPDPGNPDDVRLMAELGVTEDQFASVAEVVSGWKEWPAAPHDNVDAEDLVGAGPWGDVGPDRVFIGGGWVENHSIRDYEKVLRIGFRALRREVEDAISRADADADDYADRCSFWQAALAICDAGELLGERYAQEAERLGLERMAEACRRVPAEGARTFAEAVQALWLLHILTCGEDGINANSLGRLDRIFYPYYAADIEAGRLERTGALALMEELACKLYLEYDVQHITLGGVDADGNTAVNELSYLFLDATENVKFIRCISVRLGKASSPEFVRRCCELMARGGGIPFVFNDDCFIPALTERGIGLVDARNYAPIGCIELTVPGRTNPHAASGWFNSLKCLELALFDGCDPQTGRQLGPHTGTLVDFDSFEELFDAFCRQTETFARRMVNCCNRGEIAQQAGGPLPCWSVMTDDCIARGRDITDGGAVYNYHSVCFLGAANVADALVALKKLVFEEQAISPAQMLAALRADFEGYEPIRQMLLNDASKYGNDIAEVDELAKRAADHFISFMDTQRSPHDGRYFVHLFSFVMNVPFGRDIGATPDGRRKGEPLAYSLSPHQGRDVEGATAVLNSIARLPHNRAAGATAAIVELDPNLLAGPEGVDRLTQLTQTAVAIGVGQLQWNVTTAERLIQAQQDPERYGNIAVRVAGYSQMFKLVPKDLQDHIIARTKHEH